MLDSAASDIARRGAALDAGGLRLSYSAAGAVARILDIERLTLPAGAQLAISGPSGSGKTTLLNVLCGVERPDAGMLRWNGTDIAAMGEPARDRWRRDNVGLVFQEFHLLPGLSALGNVLLPARFGGVSPHALRPRALRLLARAGIANPGQEAATLSRGEMQRVAVARAMLKSPPILLADEPTASLDEANAAGIADLLRESASETGATLIVVTHDAALLARFADVLRLDRGRAVAA
jgi:putative ABC transport system ATP-binding protein